MLDTAAVSFAAPRAPLFASRNKIKDFCYMYACFSKAVNGVYDITRDLCYNVCMFCDATNSVNNTTGDPLLHVRMFCKAINGLMTMHACLQDHAARPQCMTSTL